MRHLQWIPGIKLWSSGRTHALNHGDISPRLIPFIWSAAWQLLASSRIRWLDESLVQAFAVSGFLSAWIYARKDFIFRFLMSGSEEEGKYTRISIFPKSKLFICQEVSDGRLLPESRWWGAINQSSFRLNSVQKGVCFDEQDSQQDPQDVDLGLFQVH